jgi:hypothetical protein
LILDALSICDGLPQEPTSVTNKQAIGRQEKLPKNFDFQEVIMG